MSKSLVSKIAAKMGRKGGRNRVKGMTAEQLSEWGKRTAEKRWKDRREKSKAEGSPAA